MLKRFKVAAEDEVLVREAALRQTVTDLFRAVGVPEDVAVAGANVLVMTDLRGVESHGVSNMLRQYVDWLHTGVLNPTPAVKVLSELPAMAVLDGDRGLGVLQGTSAMQIAIDKAKVTGVGVVTMRNSGHLGAVGHFAMQAAEQGFVGLCMTAMSVLVLPTFGALPRLGTNPIAIAAPAGTEPPFLYDAATSTIAGNKVRLARRVGADMEPGWIADPDGVPIMEPRPVPDGEGYRLGQFSLLPLGGTREQGSHKGYGLGMLVEVMTTLLAGGLPGMVQENAPFARHHFAAYNIEAFGGLAQFTDTMDRMLQTLTETPPAPGNERVLYPGLPEAETLIERQRDGIPLHREVIEWFNTACDDLGVARLQTGS